MTVSVMSAAKFLCQESGWTLTNLKLQKLLYLAHMYYLGAKKTPLINESFEAWNYGPVQPDLYQKVKVFGADPIENIFRGVQDLDEDQDERRILKEVCDQLANRSASWLVEITHWKNGAWAKNYRPGVFCIQIPNSDIEDEYKSRLKKIQDKK